MALAAAPIRSDRPSSAAPRDIEWPTWGLIVIIYGGWIGLTLLFERTPLWIGGPAAAWLGAWQMSLQHELIHGHPTSNRKLSALLGFPPLNLWLPFVRYRDLHLTHHSDEEKLTYPTHDTESYYVTSASWHRLSPLGRLARRAGNTLAGRIFLNPLQAIPRFLLHEARSVIRGVPGARRIWAWQICGIVALLYWALGVCGIPLWAYLAFFVYASFAISSIRSFAEHRAAARPEHRTAIVEKAPLLGLLFLFNNLHVVHHRWPGMPWYRLPGFYRANRDELITGNGGLVYRGYADIARRYLFREHDAPVNEWAGF